MEGKAALAQTLRDYPGGVLLVSHDRQLISESCNRFWLIDSAGLTEWHSLEEVYARLQAVAPAPDSRLALQSTPAGADDGDDEEALLARLIDLEQWLADDMARKPKHQKPSLQAQWQEEIARLLNQLT
ncbi:Glutathione-regulated potassium-efflux system ATP-binding protein [Klebsiella pneumoniae]|nr:Glutathione-regulated potassium-efflux system ATP-binding protein [Klebsiella pneumoniae]